MKNYPNTLAPLTDEGVQTIEKVKKIVDDYFHTFKGNDVLSLNYTRDYEPDWSPSEWADTTGFAGKIYHIDNIEWIDYFFGAYLEDQKTREGDSVDGDCDEYMTIEFHKSDDKRDHTWEQDEVWREYSREKDELITMAGNVKATLSYESSIQESQSTYTDWFPLPVDTPKSWIKKFKKNNNKVITTDQDDIYYSGTGDDGSIYFNTDETIMERMGFTQQQIDKMYDMYSHEYASHNGLICGYKVDWEETVNEFVNSFCNFNNEGCHGYVDAIFEISSDEKSYRVRHESECNYGSQSAVHKIMLVEDFLKTKPRMN